MTSQTFSYSPFETLLIFQSLTQSHLPSTFDNISESLKSNKFIRNGPGFDVTKFAPDALKNLYVGYMRDEVKSHAVTVGGQNGHAEDGEEPGSKKRRLDSPEIETVEDAERYRGKLPGLIGQLYARYREGVIKEIKEEEGRYSANESEIRQLETTVEEQGEGVNGAPSGQDESNSHALGTHDDTPGSARSLGRDLSTTKPALRPLSPLLNDGPTRGSGAHSSVPLERPALPKDTPQLAQQPTLKSESSLEKEGAQPNAMQSTPSLPDAATHPSPRQPPTFNPPSGMPSYYPPPQQPSQGYPQPSPAGRPPNLHISQSQQLGQPPDASPTHAFAPPPNAPPRSPVILPPPPGMQLPSSSPPRPPGSLPDVTGQHRRTPSGPSPPQIPYYSPTQQHVRPAPSPAGYPRQQYPPYPNQQSPYPTHVSPYANQQYPLAPLASRALPPPKGPLQSPATVSGQVKGTPQQQYSPYPNRSTPQGYSYGPNQAQPFGGTPYNQGQNFLNSHILWNSAGRRETPRPPMLDTSFLSTPWKTPNREYATTDPGSPTRPEEVSPISDMGESPFDTAVEKIKTTGKQGRGGRRGGRGGSAKPSPRTQDTGSTVRRNQRGSTASSMVAESTRSRSQSLISHQDDSHTSTIKSAIPRKVKHEAPSTPAGTLTEDGNDADVSAFSKDNTPRTSIRRRPGALQPFDTSTLARGASKRKRDPHDSADFDDSPPVTSTFPRPTLANPNQVLTTRNFTRTCQPLMNEVTAHKHASIFAKPLTERDAPGYKDLIYRPQDLKSIKSAIHQGSRAVAAASESVSTPLAGDAGSPPSATPSKNTLFNLQKTADVIPPKAIVNSAQLEKELMRMFANAIMFNSNPANECGFGPSFQLQRDVDWDRLARQGTDNEADEDGDAVVLQPHATLGYQRFDDGGVVKDTREMFEDVERAVRDWRIAERGILGDECGISGRGSLSRARGSLVEGSVDDSMDELGGDGEAEGMTVGLGVSGGDDEGTGTVAGRKRRRGGEV